MKKQINIILPFLAGLLMFSCSKEGTYFDVDARVYITKTIDSLPCQASIDYQESSGDHIKEQITDDWSLHHNIHYDQFVTLKAIGTNNIKSITVEITAKGSSVSNNCIGTCTVDVRKDLYDN